MFRTILMILYFLLIVTVVIVILVDTGDSGRKFAWLLIIAVLPLLGILLYFMFGTPSAGQYALSSCSTACSISFRIRYGYRIPRSAMRRG